MSAKNLNHQILVLAVAEPIRTPEAATESIQSWLILIWVPAAETERIGVPAVILRVFPVACPRANLAVACRGDQGVARRVSQAVDRTEDQAVAAAARGVESAAGVLRRSLPLLTRVVLVSTAVCFSCGVDPM